MDSSLPSSPFEGPFYKGAVVYWGPKRDPNVENYIHDGLVPGAGAVLLSCTSRLALVKAMAL